jgi:hypothetical protein
VVCPVDATPLIVSTRRQAQRDPWSVLDKRNGNQKASIEFEAVGGNRIHFFSRVTAPNKAFGTSSGALAAHDEDLASAGSPFALDSYEFAPGRKDHVEAPALRNWTVNLDS